MLARRGAAVIGARNQPASTRGWSRVSTRAPMPRRRARPIVGGVHGRPLDPPVLRRGAGGPRQRVRAARGARARAARARAARARRAHRASSCCSRSGSSGARGTSTRRASWSLLGAIGACALVLALVQPDGAGVLALYITLGIAASQLEPRGAIPLFTAGIVVISALHELVARDGTVADTIIADASAVDLLLHGLHVAPVPDGPGAGRAARRAELEASREAQAQAVALNERAHLARELHDVLAHSLAGLVVQLEGARLLARRTGADALPWSTPSSAATTSPRAGWTRRGARSRRCAAARCRGPTGSARSPTSSASRPASRRRWRSTARRASCTSEARLAVYRTAQEALTNVRRHAAAERVDVRLRYGDDGTWLTVQDHGRAANGSAEPGLGYGLTGMRERAELLGGPARRRPDRPTASGWSCSSRERRPDPRAARRRPARRARRAGDARRPAPGHRGRRRGGGRRGGRAARGGPRGRRRADGPADAARATASRRRAGSADARPEARVIALTTYADEPTVLQRAARRRARLPHEGRRRGGDPPRDPRGRARRRGARPGVQAQLVAAVADGADRTRCPTG